MIDRFATSRLFAEPIGMHHLAELIRMHQDTRVMATLGGTRTEAESERFLQQNRQHWEQHGFGLWILTDRRDGRFVGRAGLRNVHVGGTDEIELAYALTADSWGQGLAAEASEPILSLAFRARRIAEVVSFTLVDNARSQRVMKKLGFQLERELTHAGLPHVLYRLEAASWHPRGRGR